MNNRKITALPSLIICKDGTETEFDLLSEEERKEIKALMCKKINSIMSDHYTENKEEWAALAKMMNV